MSYTVDRRIFQNIMIVNFAVNMLLFAGDQAILSNSKSGWHMVVHSLSRIFKDLGLQISTLKTKAMSFPVRTKISESTVLGRVINFEYLGYVSYITNNDVVKKLHKVNHKCGTIKRILSSSTR